jgi:hypothetical protein
MDNINENENDMRKAFALLFLENKDVLDASNNEDMRKNIENIFLTHINNISYDVLKNKNIISSAFFGSYTNSDSVDILKSYFNVNNINGLDCNIIIKDSPIHHKGVFALKKILKNELITFYPCHGLKTNNTHQIITVNKKYTQENIQNIFISDYSFNFSNGYITYGDKNEYENLNCVGHMVNDAVSYDIIKKIKESDNTYENLIRYGINSITKSNSEFIEVGTYIALIANKDINIGDEILAQYGYLYWKTQNYYKNNTMKYNNKFNQEVKKFNKKQINTLIRLNTSGINWVCNKMSQ